MEPVEQAVEIAGGVRELARQIGVSHAAVSQWLHGKTRPGLAACVQIERVTEMRVRRQDLRPEWFS